MHRRAFAVPRICGAALSRAMRIVAALGPASLSQCLEVLCLAFASRCVAVRGIAEPGVALPLRVFAPPCAALLRLCASSRRRARHCFAVLCRAGPGNALRCVAFALLCVAAPLPCAVIWAHKLFFF
jgi:hypothetical protein